MSQQSTPKTEKNTPKGNVEGEGSYTATRAYDEHLKASKGAADSEKLAKEAAEALDGPEGDELRRAEQAGKKGPTAAKRP